MGHHAMLRSCVLRFARPNMDTAVRRRVDRPRMFLRLLTARVRTFGVLTAPQTRGNHQIHGCQHTVFGVCDVDSP